MAAAARVPHSDPEPSRYAASEALLARAREFIPLGAQTFSKSITQLPFGASPYFAARAKGATLWDEDGHAYVDFCNALCAVTLGYADPDVNAAAAAQVADGSVFSLSHRLEAEVAERICQLVPCAEAVRFGKNGSDATSGAIRVARAYTGRDRVLTCGYHGWQDWSIGATARSKGVPQAVRDLTTPFRFNDLEALAALLDAHAGEVAAIILEPMNVTAPAPGYLQGVRRLADKHGVVLIFDETITGFRFDKGGAQALFGVTPDLATFGKGLANGFPLSAVAGKQALMAEMEEVFFSFTMGGEAVSLAAAKAVLDKLDREPVIQTLRIRGAEVQAEVDRLLINSGMIAYASISGDPTWSFLNFTPPPQVDVWALKTLFLQEVFARGLFTLGTHNMSYAHGDEAISVLVDVYAEVFPILAEAVRRGDVAKRLHCAPLQPLFKVR
ncbi:MAG TPA: aminotransferase class III-fold pyridoxal phosphate-dependent enzyme [Caulobacteraceae bacterium]|jgi:glutamate-1-semialdehyde 2,1-aminomutase|nr:aminotransferase class III-fold pyridoxal phosphate-dependent enzyme [Caulobacteraceae bacterium]